MADKFYKETPIGNVYGGMINDYPLVNGGTHSNAYLGLNDATVVANKYQFPNQTPQYSVGLSSPMSKILPNYYGEVNTPLGKIFGGTDDGNPNVNVGFQPNEKTNYYLQALANLLRR